MTDVGQQRRSDPWQGKAALTCALTVWGVVGLPALIAYDTHASHVQVLILIGGTAFGIVLGVLGVRSPGAMNRFFSWLALLLILAYLLPVPLLNIARVIRVRSGHFISP